MTFALTAAVVQTFDPNVTDASGGQSILAAINNADPEAARLLIARPLTFAAEGTFNGDDTENVANAIMRLGSGQLGVTFPSGSGRVITCKTWARRTAATTVGYTEKKFFVMGGATPTVTQDTTGASTAAIAFPVQFAQTGTDLAFAMATAEVGGVFINIRNAAVAAIQTPVNVAAGIRWRMEVFVDTLVNLATI